MNSLLKSGTVGLLILFAGTACNDLVVPNFNEPSVDDILSNPSRVSIVAGAQGLLGRTRLNVAEMVRWMGAFGREGYPMTQTGASLPGSVQNAMSGDNFPGTTLWDEPYRNIRNANLLLDAVELSEELSEAEKAGVRGFAKTIQAYDFLNIILARWKFGAPIEVGGDPTGDPPPFESREAVLAHVVGLLDGAVQDLNAAGSSFVFGVTNGLTDFDTPSGFTQLNRALRARVAVYVDDWATALQALDQSFMDPERPLAFGAYHVFGTGSGDATNPLNRPDILFAHPRIRDDAQLRGDGSADLRAQAKVVTVPSFTVFGVTSDAQYTLYEDPSAPLPWVKNEELILLRAEANLGMGNLQEAQDDLNFIRVNSGGLEPISTLDPDALLDELLYNKRYSLIWEYGHVWIDMRHYGRLLEIPTTPNDALIVDAMPIPSNDCFSRSPEPQGCGTVTPLAGGGLS